MDHLFLFVCLLLINKGRELAFNKQREGISIQQTKGGNKCSTNKGRELAFNKLREVISVQQTK